MCMRQKRKVRVNISVDGEMLKKAKTKLSLFGGKLSTLFDAYLRDFVSSFERPAGQKSMEEKLKELEIKIRKIEEKFK